MSFSKKNEDKKLSPSVFMRASHLFATLGWDTRNDSEKSLFNRYCYRLSQLTVEEQKMFLLLTEKYKVIKQTEYLFEIIEIFKNNPNICSEEFRKKQAIYVTPLVSPKDKNKAKSGHFIQYLFKSTDIRYCENYPYQKIKIPDLIDDSCIKKIIKTPNLSLLLVDDFIGTGETAEDAIKEFLNKGVPINKIEVFTLAILNTGLSRLTDLGVTVYTNLIYQKGISDAYFEEELDFMKNIMTNLEKKLKVDKNYRFGYNGSEALITMSRTPNNTFPIFWLEKGDYSTAPFPR